MTNKEGSLAFPQESRLDKYKREQSCLLPKENGWVIRRQECRLRAKLLLFAEKQADSLLTSPSQSVFLGNAGGGALASKESPPAFYNKSRRMTGG